MTCLPACLDPVLEKVREELSKQRSKIVLWKRPITTTHYFIRELFIETRKLAVGLVSLRCLPGIHRACPLTAFHL